MLTCGVKVQGIQEVMPSGMRIILAKLVDANGVVNRCGPLVVLGMVLLTGCAPQGDAPSLEIISSDPAFGSNHPADLPIRVRFNQYLDPEALDGAIRVTSADVGFKVRVAYDPVDRALVVVPRLQLRTRVGYSVTIVADVVRGVLGETLAEDFDFDFVATAPTAPAAPAAELDFDVDLAPALEARCGCHGPEPDVFPDLVPEALVGVRSRRQPDRVLVEPGEPLQSYLVQRVLVDYPTVRGLPMPLDAPLSVDVQRRLVAWVEAL